MIIDLAGNLESRSRRYGQALMSMANQGSRAMNMLRGSAARIGGAMEAMTGRYAGAIAGMGVSYKAVRAVMDSASLDKMLIRVGNTADASREQVEELRKELFTMARSTGQSSNDLLMGFYALVQSGQGWDEALATIQAINPAMAVTGASAEVLAGAMGVAAQAFNFDLSNLETGKLMLDQMYAAGKLGNAELENLADIFARVGNNAKTAGLSFEGALAFIERMSLVERQPERLATLVDSTLRLFNNQTYQDEAARVTGVNFYNADGSRREMFDVLADMRERYRANFKTDTERDRAFSQAFGKTDLDTQRGLRIFFDAESIEDARRFSGEIGSAGGLIAKELPSAVSNAVDQTARLKAALGDAADSFARPINDAISGGIKYLLDDEKLSGTELLAGGALAAGAGFGALKFGGRALSRLGGGALGKVMQGMGGLGKLPLPLPVYIVNSRMSLTNQALSDMASGSGATGFGGRTARAAGKATGARRGASADARNMASRSGRLLSRAGGPAAALVGAIEIGSALADDTSGAEKARNVGGAAGSALGGVGGAWAGAAAGAALGSVVPVIGTAIGGALGAVIGGVFGSEGGNSLGRMIADAFTNRDQAKAIGEEMGRQAENLAESVASFSRVEIEVKGPAEARIARSPDHGDLDVLRSGLEANGIMWMD